MTSLSKPELLQQRAADAYVSCRNFLEAHIDYLDGALPEQAIQRFDAHVQTCPSCQRYDHVVRRGLLLARNVPEVEPSAHFHEQLQARLQRLEMEPAHPPMVASSATLVMIAAVLAVIALTPLVRLLDPGFDSAATPELMPAAYAPPVTLINALGAPAFSPVVIWPPAVQTSPNAPRLIDYPSLNSATR